MDKEQWRVRWKAFSSEEDSLSFHLLVQVAHSSEKQKLF